MIDDILLSTRFQGQLNFISWCSSIFDVIGGVIISLVAFLIVWCAMIKNVMAGAYCTWPKFWDMVHEVHVQAYGGDTWGSGFAEVWKGGTSAPSHKGRKISGFTAVFYAILPDIFSYTEFEDETISAKDYFIKAIPFACIAVFIGVFIWDGYYRDTIALAGKFGTSLLQRTVLSVDPDGVVDSLLGMTSKPEFSTNGATDDYHKFVNNVSTQVWNRFNSQYPDLKNNEIIRGVQSDIENWVFSWSSEVLDYTNTDEWKEAINVSMVVGAPDLSVYADESATSELQIARGYGFSTSAGGGTLTHDSTTDVGVDNYIVVRLQFTKKASTGLDALGSALGSVSNSLTDSGSVTWKSTGATSASEDGKVTITVPSNISVAIADPSVGSWSGNTLVIDTTSEHVSLSGTTIKINNTGKLTLKYTYGTTVGQTITSISLGASSDSFTNDHGSWADGEVPATSSSSSSGTTTEDEGPELEFSE